MKAQTVYMMFCSLRVRRRDAVFISVRKQTMRGKVLRALKGDLCHYAHMCIMREHLFSAQAEGCH